MALNPGTRLGPYEVLSALGAGGMGEVYRARDTRLDRDVAIKILVEQCRGCLLPGYLIVRPIVPVQGLSALPAEAASQLGPLLQVIVRSIEAVLSPARVYVAQFGEEQQDLHFHVFPRTAALTADCLKQHQGPHSVISGPLLFDWARDRYRANTASTETVRVFEVLRQRLRVDR